ncbi:MAG: HNH endonuclease [Acidimicrobiia bacterium]|nr:HNH endonuclease [Acidimicrobiia bacterium]
MYAPDGIGLVREGLQALAGRDRSGWSAGARTAELRELLEARARLDAELLVAVGGVGGGGGFEADGVGAVAWLAHHGSMTGAEASGWVRRARLVRDHPRIGKALAAGEVSASHVGLMTKAASHREEVFVDHLDGLVDAARGLAPERYRHVIRRWAVLADDLYDRGEPEPGRWLRTTVTFAGAVRVDGILDPAGGAVLLAALDARSRPDGPGDPRSPIERRADALVALAAGDERPTVNLDVLVDVHTLEGRPPTDPAAVRCDLTGVGPIGPDLIGLLACDANIARVLTRGPSEILDLGRRTRIVTPAQRRALAVRDGGCVFPGCTRPEPWCDAHHIIHWLHGGPGDLDNMALVCRAHHTAVHQGRWALTRTPHGTITATPNPPPHPPPPPPPPNPNRDGYLRTRGGLRAGQPWPLPGLSCSRGSRLGLVDRSISERRQGSDDRRRSDAVRERQEREPLQERAAALHEFGRVHVRGVGELRRGSGHRARDRTCEGLGARAAHKAAGP